MKTNPAVMLESEPQWLHPIQTGPTTLLALARDPSTFDAVTTVLERLVPDAYIEHMRRYYATGRERFGAHWRYADQLTVLHAAAQALRPRSYLEIGVFRGRSLSVVAAAAPECALHAFDLWIAGYASLENAGPELVREQLRRVGHRGELYIESGDSHETVPRFLERRPDLGFDLVTVDGDHTEEGARRDLETVLPRLNVGGALVFDDIRHPSHPWLERVWDDTVGALPSFVCAKFVEVGSGVAVAIRRQEDDAVISALHGDGESRLAHLAHALEELRAKRVERIQVLETEMERRLELIQSQGLELHRLHAQVEAAEAARAQALRVVEQQEVALARVPALEADLSRLGEYLQRVTADSAERLDVLLRLNAELERVRATAGDQLALLQTWVEGNMSGLFQRRQGRALLALLGDARARLGLPQTATPAGDKGAAAAGPDADSQADASPETPALAPVTPPDLAASNPRSH